jgi:NAD(P)-dependent dehydrogenase (short-subunit alcohol dehydrogenase family)
MDLNQARVWVVGASSGIGAELARELVRRGARVAVPARTRADLEKVSGGDMLVVPLDVTDRAAVVAAAQQVTAELGGLDVLVAAAGHWQQTTPGELDLDTFTRHVEVNLLGMAACISAVLPAMRSRGSGALVGIASVAGYRGIPGAEAYGPMKAAQINLLEALRAGLRGSGVTVQTVCPGFVDTPMTESNDFPMPFMISADRAATTIADGIESGKAEIVFPWQMALLMKSARLVPVRLWGLLAKPRS